jgi:hypothetical protein
MMNKIKPVCLYLECIQISFRFKSRIKQDFEGNVFDFKAKIVIFKKK